MKKIAKKKHYNKIAIVLLVVLLCNFLVPTYISLAKDDEKAESHLTQFFCSIGDIILNLLQENITGVSGLKYNGKYALRYSPGVIFSGRLAAFDINFISPMPNEERYTIKQEETEILARTTVLIADASGENNNTSEEINIDDITTKFCTEDKLYEAGMLNNCEEKQYTPNEDLIRRSDILSYAAKIQSEYKFYDEETKQKEENVNINIDENFSVYSWWFIDGGNNTTTKYIIYMSYSNKIQEENNKNTRIYQIKMTETVYEKAPIVESIAGKMKGTIATWYNVSREIALVGLLCVLLYVAIRGIISGSAGDKAKYKKMLVDWLTAMIIVMTLHYIISITLAVSKSITDIFGLKIINEDGIDVIFSELRNNIGDGDFMKKLLNTVMYYYLVFITIKFTVMYFKRVVYMAFLTMIAPLIGLTYPLDKIKDGQAQAFTMWIREFVFNALLQPLHLVLYYIFIGSSIMSDFATENPFFSLVVISFLKPAEKMLRKMFGFDKTGKLGNLESAFKGAAIMNMMNKFTAMGGKGKKAPAGASSAGSEETGKVRMANTGANGEGNNPYAALVEGPEQPRLEEEQQQPVEQQVSEEKTKSQQKKLEHQRRMEMKKKEKRREKGGKNNKGGKNKNANYSGSKNARQAAMNNKAKTPSAPSAPSTPSTPSSPSSPSAQSAVRTGTSNGTRGNANTSRRTIKKPSFISRVTKNPVIRGCTSVGAKTLKMVAKGTLKGGIKVAGMATLGTIGFAAGIATGEMENAFAGAIGGITAGNKIGGNIVNTALNAKENLLRTGNDIKQTYENGKYGEKEAERRRKVREFKQTKEYRNLLEKFTGSQEKIDKYIDAGIMDVSKIRIALTNNYSVDNNIAYMNMAKLCPAEIFEDRDKFNVYLESHGIPKTNANEIYRAVRMFK